MPRFTTSRWLSLSFANTFHIMFWINVATMVFVGFLVAKLWWSLRQVKLNPSPASDPTRRFRSPARSRPVP